MLHRTVFVAMALLLLAACGGEEVATTPAAPEEPSAPAAATTLDRSSPEALVKGIFEAARTDAFSLLADVADPVDADGDAKDVAGVADAGAEAQEEFRAYFAKGRIRGEIEVDGDTARVPILFGPDGDREETLELVRRDGVWYLKSF